jgi:hypothetical protein
MDCDSTLKPRSVGSFEKRDVPRTLAAIEGLTDKSPMGRSKGYCRGNRCTLSNGEVTDR